MAAWLAAAGHEVRVVTAPPYYPDWQVWRGYRATRYTLEVWQSVRAEAADPSGQFCAEQLAGHAAPAGVAAGSGVSGGALADAALRPGVDDLRAHAGTRCCQGGLRTDKCTSQTG
ncbi:MAG: hypothetical protein Q8Q81_00155 [Oxalobacteraceae bacterium]|nr:hypothetical protein [Oxalobacteraceae bacterium]